MKTRLLVPLVGFAISFGLSIFAQQKDVADPQTTQKILAIGKAIDEGINNNDPAAIAANYTRDAVIVTDRGANNWSASHSEIDTDLYEWWHPKNHITKVDGNAYQLIGTAGNELWATGEWSETGQGKNGEPIPIKGYWAAIVVREGDDWKIRVAIVNLTPESVILINQSLGNQTSRAPQPAATPSPTGSPSTQ